MFFSWNRAHFGAWVITSSPLILGMLPSDEQLAPFLDVIGNAEAIAINQQWHGHPGMFVEEVPGPGASPLNRVQLWMKPLRHDEAVAVFVLNYCAIPQNFTVEFSKILALSSGGTYSLLSLPPFLPSLRPSLPVWVGGCYTHTSSEQVSTMTMCSWPCATCGAGLTTGQRLADWP